MKLQLLIQNEDNSIDYLLSEFNHMEIKQVKLKNTDSRLITFETTTNNIEDAKAIDLVYKSLEKKIPFKVLIDERASYFNKRLFPLINDFERLLRKFLYIGAEISNEHDVIKELEDKSLEKIFTLLFVDSNYSQDFFEKIKKNARYKRMNKTGFLELLDENKENSLWKKMYSSLEVDFIQDKYLELKNYRNSVMHAHNIDYHKYSTAKEMFKNANEVLISNIDVFTGEGDYPSINYTYLSQALKDIDENTELFLEKVGLSHNLQTLQALKRFASMVEKNKSD